MKKHFPFLPLLVLLSIESGAQVNLRGRVLDKANMLPVPGANVALVGSALKATTDAQGRFTLQGTVSAQGVPKRLPPQLRGGDLFVDAERAGQELKVEIFGFAGESLSAREYVLDRVGWNRLNVLPWPGRDFLGFARITTAGVTQVRPLLSLEAPVRSRWLGSAAAPAPPAGKRAASAPADPRTAPPSVPRLLVARDVEVTADKLVKKTVTSQSDDADLGDIVLDYPPRRLGVGAPPIYGATVLFDGTQGQAAAATELKAKWKDWIPAVTGAELAKYTAARDQFKIAKDPEFLSDANRATVQTCCNTLWGYDDIQAITTHGDVQIHVEFNCMGRYDADDNPNASDPIGSGQPGYCNSGVYVQSRYEVQIQAWSQSPGSVGGNHDMAALVDDYAPSANANKPNGQWQAYDITFRTARYNGTTRSEYAYMSVWWNGTQVHNNRVAHGTATGLANHSGEELNPTLYGLKLQSEGTDVRYRNIWIKNLKIDSAKTNFGW